MYSTAGQLVYIFLTQEGLRSNEWVAELIAHRTLFIVSRVPDSNTSQIILLNYTSAALPNDSPSQSKSERLYPSDSLNNNPHSSSTSNGGMVN